ncbi:transporter substrate-binding domain-containing protein [Bradyrhizobium sp. Ec3.3]|uniref:transporter substrate-binding domain-containing protein n=1 Tax=Bradyrhizobium sp. Ec3.3 TaxID=189753 RepID=UPI0004865176|nr:transporter substrate-binding domain-containing protein [Bradyrhizobium sp. Ec3.3]
MAGLEFSRRTALVGSAALVMLSAGVSAVCAESITDRVLKEGKITIGIHNRSPWGFRAGDGSATGFHPDMVKAVLGPLGVKEVDFVITDFSALIPALMSKRIDAIASGMGITRVRCDQVIFTNPDIVIKLTLAVLPGNPLNIHSLADVANSTAIRIGVIRGATDADIAAKAGVPKDRMLLLPDYSSLVSALLSDRINGILLPTASVAELLKDPELKGKLERASPFVGLVENGQEVAGGYPAIVFRQEDSRLRDIYDESLAKRKAEGTLRKIAAEYGFTDADTNPDGLTAKQLCPDNYR